jgi:protein-tyrosine phosphatase
MRRVCFVCLGNICRSPTAEAVFRRFVADAGLSDRIAVDSAGTAAYHVGEAADARARSAGRQRGYTLNGRARQFARADFDRFDYVLAMDEDNRRALLKLAPSAAAKSKVRLLRSFDATAPDGAEVPDPYYGGPRGFDEVIDICERACRGLLTRIASELDPA